MKHKLHGSDIEVGPKRDWGKWRASKDQAIAAPRRNKAAIKLNERALKNAKDTGSERAE